MTSRLTWIVLTLALALYGIWAKPLVLGLDLRGGVTQRYELEAPDTTLGDTTGMIEATVETLRTRINAYGIKESAITRQGDNEIVIELPGYGKEEADTIKSAVSRVGRLEFRIALRADGSDDDTRNSVVVADQQERLRELLEAEQNVGKGPDDIDVSSLDINVPDTVFRWVPYADKLLMSRRGAALDGEQTLEEVLAEAPLSVADYELVRFEQQASRTFTGADIAGAQQDMDGRGSPAVGISMRPDRASEFGDWTEPNKGRAMAMLLDGRVAESPAVINDRLENRFIISSGNQLGGFTSAEIKDYLTVIKSGSLQMKPRLLFENTVGPSLGESSIKAGLGASIAGFLAVIVFMLVYYRLNGVIAALCLILNMTLLTGILMFLGATLTLPGIAGLVLTLGMAVDANILVFERFREEADRAKSFSQAVKLGFEKAFSTIIDANVTTFVTAFILYKLGSGPVRGFAVILMFGVMTSVFSVLVFGRVLYDTLVARGVQSLSMGRLIKAETHVPFMSKAKLAGRLSIALVIISLVGFFTADRDKYGLDFLGGYKAQVVLLQPATQGEIKGLVDEAFPGVGAQVVSVLDESTPAGQGSRQFVIKLKAGPEDEGEQASTPTALEERYEYPLKAALAGRILPDFVTDLTLVENTEAMSTAVSATLHFERAAGTVDPAVVASALGFLGNVETKASADNGVAVAGSWARIGLDDQQVVQRLRTAMSTDAGLPKVSEAFIESTTIGSRVGTELRDSAIRAMLLSFIAIVLYIRVRFREYRYGIAAIIALAHDVCITLGVVALMHFSGLVDVEIDLAMIAAFLTIIGYSLNDTIVLFDRVRENLPRLTGKSYPEVLDISINQTLARTVLTSFTTLVALLLIFSFNYGKQNVLEGFSFAMIIGVLVGTYSSIFVASPALMLLAGKTRSHAAPPTAESGKKGGSRRSKQGVPA